MCMPSERQIRSSGNLTPPVENTEALICARNAERRRLAKLPNPSSSNTTAPEPTLSPPTEETTTPSELPSPYLTPMQPTELPYTPGAFSNTGGSTPKDGPSAGLSTLPKIPQVNKQSTSELVCLLLAAQHASLVQSLADQKASAEDQQALAADRRATQDRMAQFEQALLRLSVKPVTPTPSPEPSDRGVDLQRFRISDGPVYRGPFQSVEPFLNWVKLLEVFFDTEGVTLDTQEILFNFCPRMW
ncbi:hypothetical protein VP01_3207g2 [Puccinia sorghi]|uniref:Uncharacterized protein n=1 Tax=Puccinia sorghi TaxID=27349 RepID=A0A0L6UYH5_9BASI|nr:hypothetical protein VP01_3207g2 [Puccinia sorghi]